MTPVDEEAKKGGFKFPGAVTTLAIVTLLVWVAALFMPSGRYLTDIDGSPIPDGMRILQLPPEYSGLQVITPELIARATADGLPIWVWPNDRDLENQASYLAFLEMGVTGLNINFPAQGVEAVRQYVAV